MVVPRAAGVADGRGGGRASAFLGAALGWDVLAPVELVVDIP